MFFAAGSGTASAATPGTATAAGDCKLGPLLCGLLGAGTKTPTSPPTTSAPAPTAKPAAPAAKPKPRPKPAPAHHARKSGSSGSAPRPVVPPAIGAAAPQIPVPPASLPSPPALPDVTAEDPLVLPEPEAGQPEEQARLAAATDAEDGGTLPPLLVATASGVIGAVAALNLSVMSRRRRGHGRDEAA